MLTTGNQHVLNWYQRFLKYPKHFVVLLQPEVWLSCWKDKNEPLWTLLNAHYMTPPPLLPLVQNPNFGQRTLGRHPKQLENKNTQRKVLNYKSTSLSHNFDILREIFEIFALLSFLFLAWNNTHLVSSTTQTTFSELQSIPVNNSSSKNIT